MKKIASTDVPSKANEMDPVENNGAQAPATPGTPGETHRDGTDGTNGDAGSNGTPPPESVPRKFERLRLNVNFASQVGVKKHLLTVPIRKATKFEWVQCHPDEAWRLQVAMLTWKDEQEKHYVVDPEHWSVTPEIVPTLLVTAVNTQGTVFLLPIRLPGADGRQNEWHRTLLEGAQLAMAGNWVRFVANINAGGYDVWSAPGNLGTPNWPTTSFEKLLEVALRDRIVDHRDHPVLRRLRGEM
jgi:hypothetical protein